MVNETTAEKKAPDLSEGMLTVEGIETDEELLLARDLTSGLVKTIKAFRFFPPDNPTLTGFRDQLHKKFRFFLNKYPSLMIQIGEYDLSYRGKSLYENRDVKGSLAYHLYKDGLRELRFTKGLEEWEVQGLIDIIRRGDNLNAWEDDIVTLMWERDFTHISYVATDEFLEEASVVIPDNVDQFRRNLVFKPVAHHVEADMLEEESEDATSLDEILARAAKETPSFVSNRSVYFLTPDEVEGLRSEVDTEIDPAFALNILDVLFEILTMENDPESYQDTLQVILKILDAVLARGEFRKAADLLERVYIILKTYELKDWQIESLYQLVIEAGEERRMERIGKILEEETRFPLEDAHRYLLLLQKNAIPSMIQLLGKLKNSKTRRMISDALAEIGKNAIDLFTPFMDDRPWFLVRNIVYILGRIGREQAFPYLQKAFHHEEVRVRREAVQALGLIGGPKTIGVLVNALTDRDIRIRSMAAINLAKIGKTVSLIPLLEVVQSKEFQKKDPIEIKAFFDAIGMIGSNEALPALRQLLERKGWFGRGRVDKIRIGAARALAMIGTSEAKAILESGRQSKDEAIREACIRAARG
ncbi:MAG TPA: HEAT repeat domain-containing protein [Thermodesulfobacteriota bacterium]|nr:HEAT repeat domain-containing protein [Thermodesulfobacteriota bacterium]